MLVRLLLEGAEGWTYWCRRRSEGRRQEGGVAMHTKREVEQGVTILKVSGQVTLGESAKQFAAALQDVLDESQGGVVIDLADIDYVDSTGIGELVGYLQKFTRSGRKLVLLQPHQRIEALLKLTRLDTVFPIFRERQEAILHAGAPTA